MNLREIANKTRISMTALRKLERMKIDFGNLDAEDDMFEKAASIRFTLMRKGKLSVVQCMDLIRDKAIYGELKKYRIEAERQITALGDLAQTGAPFEVQVQISAAATGDDFATGIVAQWLRTILPATGIVEYQWIAVRLCYGLPDGPGFAELLKHISFALMHVRRREDFQGYWRSIDLKYGKRTILYSRPFDL